MKSIAWTIQNDIGHAILNHPPSNTMSFSFFAEFRHLIDLISGIKPLKAIIISGQGRHFSSGANIDELITDFDLETLTENYLAFQRLEQLDIPVVAAISGVCLGSALELALCCHFRLCTEDAVFGLPESTYNLMPGIGGISRLLKITGKAKAVELVLRGNTFSACDALEIGLVDLIVSKKELHTKSISFAGAIPHNHKLFAREVIVNKLLF